MNRSKLVHLRRAVLGALLLLVSTVVPVPAALASEDSGSITLTASIGPELSLMLDHTSASFGTNLTFDGDRSNSADPVCSTFADIPVMYYIWGTLTSTVVATVPYTRYVSATENGGQGASSLRIASGDLRYLGAVTAPDASGKCRDSVTGFNQPFNSSYLETSFLGFQAVPLTTSNAVVSNGVAGTTPFSTQFALRIPSGVTFGTFSSTVTYTVISG